MLTPDTLAAVLKLIERYDAVRSGPRTAYRIALEQDLSRELYLLQRQPPIAHIGHWWYWDPIEHWVGRRPLPLRETGNRCAPRDFGRAVDLRTPIGRERR